MDPNNKSKPQFKKYCSFCYKNNHSVSTCFVLICSKNQNHFLHLRLLPFINILKTFQINLIILATVVEVIVTLPADLLATLGINLVCIHVLIHVLDTILKPPPVHIRLTTIVIDLDMINITIKIPTNHTFSRTYYNANSSRSPSKYYPRSRERSSIFNTSTFNRYNSPYRPPSKPHNDRYRNRPHSFSNNHSQSQYKPSINLTHPSTPPLQSNSHTEVNFEINMYHPNPPLSQSSSSSTEHANAITPSTLFVNLYIFKPSEDTSIPSKLELLFLLDSGASICVLNLLTFTFLADHFLKCSRHSPHQNEYKTLTVANKSEVPILHNLILTLHTSLHGNTRTLVIPFAVANIQYSILGTPFFEKYVKTLNIECMSLTFNTPHESRINTLPFTAHKEKDYPFFLHIHHQC